MISLEYILGSFLTLGLVLILFNTPAIKNMKNNKVLYRQSDVFQLTKDYIKMPKTERKERQSDRHERQSHIQVLIMQDRAFWIKNNSVYTAEVENDEVIKSSAVQVDMMRLDKVELDKMIFIIDQLTERQNHDRRDPGIN